MSKFRVCWHKIAHLATSRWHRTEQHAIERSKYRVGLQDASQAQLKAQTDKKDKKDAIYYPCTSFFMFDTKSVGILAIWGGARHWPKGSSWRQMAMADVTSNTNQMCGPITRNSKNNISTVSYVKISSLLA